MKKTEEGISESDANESDMQNGKREKGKGSETTAD